MKLKTTANPFGASTSKKTKSSHPQILTKEAVDAAQIIVDLSPKVKDMTALIDESKTILNELVAEAWLEFNEGKSETVSSFEVPCPKGHSVLVSITSRYKEVAAEEVEDLIEELGIAAHFEEKMIIKLDSRKIPEAALSPFLNELKALCDKHGATEAVDVKQVVVPVAGFHEERHKLMSKELNDLVHQAIPAVASVRAR